MVCPYRVSASREPPVGAVTFALCASAFVLLAGPSVGVRDAGELTAAAFLVDVPHPTGFVADMVLARIAMLVPFGDVAFRANLVVALAMAGACALAARIVFLAAANAPMAARLAAAALTVATLASSRTVLRAGTAFEVYALSLLAALAAVALVVQRPEGSHRLAALLVGATLLMHTQARPAALVALGVCALDRDARAFAPRRAAVIVACGVLAALPVAYLIVAARAGRPIDWGDPSDASRWFAHVTARRIREAYAARMFVAWRVPENLAHIGRIAREDLGWVPLALGAIALPVALAHRALRWVVVVGAVDVLYAALVNPMGLGDRQTLFVAEACLCVLAGTAIAWGATRLAAGSFARFAPVAPALGGALILAALLRADGAYAARADGWSETEVLLGGGALGAVPPRSIVLCESDDLCGGALFAQYVEGERPDVAVLPRQHLADGPTWRRFRARAPLRIAEPAWSGLERERLRVARLRWLVANGREQVRWQQGEIDDERLARVRLGSSETPVLATLDAPVGATDRDALAWLARRDVRGDGGRRLGASVLVSVGRRVAVGGLALGVPFWRAAIVLDPDHAVAYTNLGVAMARAGDLLEAIRLTERATAIDPERRTAWRNLAEYRTVIGDHVAATEAMREAMRRGN